MNLNNLTPNRGQKRISEEPGGSAAKLQRGGVSQSKLDSDLSSNNIYAPLLDAPENPNTVKTLKHLPPIKITQKLNNPKEVKQTIREWVSGTIHFRTGKDVTEILVYSVADHTLLQNKLKEAKVEFFTFTPKSEIPKKLVIKGIDSSYTVDKKYCPTSNNN